MNGLWHLAAFWLSFTGAVKRQRRMGCCEGKLPNPDDFLAAQSPRPVGPFLECAWVETLARTCPAQQLMVFLCFPHAKTYQCGKTIINHSLRNGLYHLSMVIWGMVYYCFHIKAHLQPTFGMVVSVVSISRLTEACHPADAVSRTG